MRGYPIRFDLDLILLFTANPEEYTRAGKIITQLKDRIGAEIRTHYPLTRELGIKIIQQEARVPADGEIKLCRARFHDRHYRADHHGGAQEPLCEPEVGRVGPAFHRQLRDHDRQLPPSGRHPGGGRGRSPHVGPELPLHLLGGQDRVGPLPRGDRHRVPGFRQDHGQSRGPGL